MAEAETQVQEDENVEVTLDQSNEPDEKNTEEVTVSSEDTSNLPIVQLHLMMSWTITVRVFKNVLKS